jgi:aminopeptidase
MDDRAERLARLIVDFGANVQPGQVVDVAAGIGEEELVRAVAASAYARGASFVDVGYFDPWLKRARVEHVADALLEYLPPWYGERIRQLGEAHACAISLTAPTAPDVFDGLDAMRLGRDAYPRVKEWNEVLDKRTINWCVAPSPTPAWARLVYPQRETDAALEKLWEHVIHVCRLDDENPVAAWRERSAELKGIAARMDERRFEALHFGGDGTDLTVGLLPSSRWVGGGDATVDGIEHMANVPTEEIFSAPDPERVDGVVRATRPLVDYSGIIDGLRVRFERGRAVQIDADTGADTIRALASRDENANRLGEVALVDREGRVGKSGTVFYNTLLDENAASHVAFGDAYEVCVAADDDRKRINDSQLHLDFMIGGSDVAVTGITRDGERVPVLRDGSWAL